MARYPARYSYAIGPGGISPAVKALIFANVAVFVMQVVLALASPLAMRAVFEPLALSPHDVVQRFWLWQLVTYMFLHAGVFHILFNMLSLWMFGTDLERLWGSRFFTRYYFVTGIGAGIVTVLVSLLPFSFAQMMYIGSTVGASGAIFGLLLAYGVTYPDRPIYLYFLFQIPAKYFVIIVGAVALYSSLSAGGGGVAHFAHLGGIAVGYLYLNSGRRVRFHPLAELKYRYTKWKIGRLRKKFDVHSGGRSDDWNGRIH
jgi:membrane associated rhomboid family serine protease